MDNADNIEQAFVVLSEKYNYHKHPSQNLHHTLVKEHVPVCIPSQLAYLISHAEVDALSGNQSQQHKYDYKLLLLSLQQKHNYHVHDAQ